MGYGEECALMHRINVCIIHYERDRLFNVTSFLVTELASLISEPIPCHI
jgi:hypothetical protein